MKKELTQTGNIVAETQDLRHLTWSKIRHSSGTAGSFLKATETFQGKKYYYKLSCFDAFQGIVGYECVNEIVADRLLAKLRIPHLSYDLIHARIRVEEKEYVTWLCRSEDYKMQGESKIALDTFYQMERRSEESPLAFCLRMGWADYIYQMLTVDFLILNRDRHGANIEVLRNREKKTMRLAPLFDHGLSFFFSAREEKELKQIDPLEDKKVQCFVGSSSATQNLQLIPKDWNGFPGVLTAEDRDFVLRDLENVAFLGYMDALWDMLWIRWQYYESIFHT